MRWRESWRADPAAREIADRHYNRQKVGADQFVPPGRCVVLVIPVQALWVTSWPFGEYVQHAWPGAWICAAFRNERWDLHLSSELVIEAVAATRFYWEAPAEGMITFVDPTRTRRKRDPGRCFRRAGFHVSGKHPLCLACRGKPERTKGGLVALHLATQEVLGLVWRPPPGTRGTGSDPALAWHASRAATVGRAGRTEVGMMLSRPWDWAIFDDVHRGLNSP
jgi:hypothetical protein